jgi:Butirosin biosynthesis protein H, N-terminal
VASILIGQGHDPVVALGAGWDFYHGPGEVPREEFYYPARWDDPARCLAPYHPVRGSWGHPQDADAGHGEVRRAVAEGLLPVVAVDNFHLPFRPAYHDVHAAHTVIVHGFDDEAGTVSVLDSMPPAFHGTVSQEDLANARGSGNPSEEADTFFGGTPIAGRWLRFEVTGEMPDLDREWVAGVVAANVERFAAATDGPALSGLTGVDRFVDQAATRAAGGDGSALEELYVVGWAAQANAGLHADFLLEAGRRLAWPALAEAGRLVELVAHHWTALRIAGAHGRADPGRAAGLLARRRGEFVRDHERALEALDRTVRRG